MSRELIVPLRCSRPRSTLDPAQDQWPSTDFARSLHAAPVPSVCLHGEYDEIVPFQLGKKLHDSLPKPKQFVAFRSGHNDIVDSDPELWSGSIYKFLRLYVAPYPEAGQQGTRL